MTTEQRLALLEARLREIEDREAIFDCIKRSSRGIDRFDAELTSSSFHPESLHANGRSQVAGAQYAQHANKSHGMLFDATLHNITLQLCEIDGDVAHAESYSLGLFLDKHGETGRMLAGRYIDRLEKRDGAWRIVLRRATVEVALEGKAVLPNGQLLPGSNYLRGNRDHGDPSYERPLGMNTGAHW